MKKLPLYIIILLASCTFKNKEGFKILEKTIDQLSKLKTIEYTLIIKDADKTENAEFTDTAFFYFDFTSADTLIGAKYDYKTPTSEQAFDGKMVYNCDVDEHRILYDSMPSVKILVDKIFLQGSFLQLKKILPKIISDPNTKIISKPDVKFNNNDCYQLNVKVKGKELVKFSIFEPTEDKFSYSFTILIDKSTFIPQQFICYYNENITLTSNFIDIKIPASRNNVDYSYKKFPADYNKIPFNSFFEDEQLAKDTIIKGQLAPDWTLPNINGDSVKLSNLRGKKVLLEFMFQYCQACIKATPVIDQIYSEYKNKGFVVYAIDIRKKFRDGYSRYAKKENIMYPVLYNGKKVSARYGVESTPAFFFIDKNGNVKASFVGYADNLKSYILKLINDKQ